MKNNGYSGKSHAHSDKKKEKSKRKCRKHNLRFKTEATAYGSYVVTIETDGMYREEFFDTYDEAKEFEHLAERINKLRSK